MEHAPTGRLFGAISTLSDMSARAAQALEEGSRAMELSDEQAATRIGQALAHMDGLAVLASAEDCVDIKARKRAGK